MLSPSQHDPPTGGVTWPRRTGREEAPHARRLLALPMRYFFVTVIWTEAVLELPPVSVTVTVAVYVPAFEYL